MVLGVGAFLSEDYETCYDEISEIKDVCHDVPLKVILETGALQSAQNIKKAAVLTMYAGADFIAAGCAYLPGTALRSLLPKCDKEDYKACSGALYPIVYRYGSSLILTELADFHRQYYLCILYSTSPQRLCTCNRLLWWPTCKASD